MLLSPDTPEQSQEEDEQSNCPNEPTIFCLTVRQEQRQYERGAAQQTTVEVEESKMSHAVVVIRSTPLFQFRGGEF
jgi:hypothetical protein